MGMCPTKYHEHKLATITNEGISVQDLDKSFVEINIQSSFMPKFDSYNSVFDSEIFIAIISDGERTLYVRRDRTYSIIQNSDNLLLDIGSVQTNHLPSEFEMIGFEVIFGAIYTLCKPEGKDYLLSYNPYNNTRSHGYRIKKKLPQDINLIVSKFLAEKIVKSGTLGSSVPIVYIATGDMNTIDWSDYLENDSSL